MRLGVSDPNSYAQPDQLTLRHVDLDWTVLFDPKIIKAVAFLRFKVVAAHIKEIVLDVRDIKIKSILFQRPEEAVPIDFIISDTVKDVGSKLTILLPAKVKRGVDLLISYETSPEATGLTWLPSEATCGKKFPFLYSQCQPHHARSILPCQDTPAVKFTYTAVVSSPMCIEAGGNDDHSVLQLRHPSLLTGLMSAIRTYTKPGCSYFQQALPIPSYLLAVVVAKLVAKPLGPR
jgi:leukotriene-A4 hydrolase